MAPSRRRPYLRLPRALFAEAQAALGPGWRFTDPEYTADGLEHFIVKHGLVAYLPDDSVVPQAYAREMQVHDLDLVIRQVLPQLHAGWIARDPRRAAPLRPLAITLTGSALPVVIDDPTARSWRWCRCCWALFHTRPGQPGQLYDTQACGRLAHAWMVYAMQAPRRRDQAIPTPAAVEMFGWRRCTTRWYGHWTHRALIRRTRAAQRQRPCWGEPYPRARLSQRVQTWWRRHR